ncbi:M6 family metalloprotease domain-containing protein [Prevotella sp. A2931]|uniref:M6 family metalloprotease domain-containing protein n=1 Tax=Prevotella illustrans TaxID=2800387 RepID=A0ABS3M3E6_9BACT|nr:MULTISPECIES: M6 family metalloprotease domain-containing protein [Prevotella]MBO1362689.1 M6 family metalloprotease domain-containing protein [Prevotella illustrans]PTL25147.1 peptidase M6 [Prevotella sp. oral taxon 820]
MKRTLSILLLFTLSSIIVFADHPVKVVNKFGQLVSPPVVGTEESKEIIPNRCETGRALLQTRAIIGKNRYIPTNLGAATTIRIPVILAAFQDQNFTINQVKTAFEQFFNKMEPLDDFGNNNNKNNGSVKSYFKDMSNGAFNLQFDIYGPVTLPQKTGYYGGSNPNNSSDEKRDEMVADAVNLIKGSVSDASIYDANNDGVIDCVYVVYAGLGQNNGGQANTVWACTSTVNGALGDKKLGFYSICAELQPYKVKKESDAMCITGIGVSCHELSHAMGLPDIYPLTHTSGYKQHNQNMEYWDLMDGGEYKANGWYPTAYTAWEKSQMGWQVDIQELNSSQHVSMPKTTVDQGRVYKIPNSHDPNEYFLLENIQNEGWNYGGQNAHGLLIYHVCFPTPDTYMSMSVNGVKGKPNMAVVPADGRCYSYDLLPNNSQAKKIYYQELAGDPFPGSSNTGELTDLSNIPNFYWYTQDGSAEKALLNPDYFKTDLALKNITETDGTISFDFYKNISTGISPTPKYNLWNSSIYNLNGNYMGKDLQKLPRGIYVVNGKKIIIP